VSATEALVMRVSSGTLFRLFTFASIESMQSDAPAYCRFHVFFICSIFLNTCTLRYNKTPTFS
jgi:hypothetical protein